MMSSPYDPGPPFEPTLQPRLPEAPNAEEPESLTYPFWNWEDIALFFGLGLPCLVFSILLLEIVFLVVPGKPGGTLYFLIAQTIGYVLWFASLYMLLRVRYDAPFLHSLAWTMPKDGFWRYVIQGPMLAFGVALLGVALRTPQVDMPFKALMSDRFTMMLVGLFGVSIGPLCEELAFRGFLMPVAVRSLGSITGVILTSIPFALLHGPMYSWSWRHLLLLILAGSAFGRVRIITGSTAAAVLTHATYNLTFFTAQIVQGPNP